MRWYWWVLGTGVILGVIGGLAWFGTVVLPERLKDVPGDIDDALNRPDDRLDGLNDTAALDPGTWEELGLAVAGNYADAEVVALPDGTYRMYYAIEPEVPGNQLEIYSATSSDGVTWTQESGTRRTFSTFPDVLRPIDPWASPEQPWRMYFQNSQVIKSATSEDGLTWTDEPGVRLDTTNPDGIKLENVAASTTIQLAESSYLMVYRGSIDAPYNNQVPNKSQGILMYATSTDGLEWAPQGIAIETRDATLEGWADGPEFIQWDDAQRCRATRCLGSVGTLKLFFWGYRGVYESTVTAAGEDVVFGEPTLVYRGANVNPNVMYSPNPPGDPTLARIDGIWTMFYGGHQEGIKRAVLKYGK